MPIFSNLNYADRKLSNQIIHTFHNKKSTTNHYIYRFNNIDIIHKLTIYIFEFKFKNLGIRHDTYNSSK